MQKLTASERKLQNAISETINGRNFVISDTALKRLFKRHKLAYHKLTVWHVPQVVYHTQVNYNNHCYELDTAKCNAITGIWAIEKVW